MAKIQPRTPKDRPPAGPRDGSVGTTVGAIQPVRNGIHVKTGWPVVFADTPVELVLTQHDIDTGIPGKPDDCAFAQCSVRTRLGSKRYPGEFYKTTAFFPDPKTKTVLQYSLPLATQKTIYAYDLHGNLVPGRYWMSAKIKSKKPVSTGKGNKLRTKRATPRHMNTGIRGVV